MIDHDKDDDIYEIDCDYCGAEHVSIDAARGWQWMIDQLKKKGWMIRKMGEEWRHRGPGCSGENKPW